MLNFKITDWDTIVLKNGREISVEKFFNELEENIETDDYGVWFDERTNVLFLRYHGDSYQLNVKTSNNTSIVEKLKSYAQIEKMYKELYSDNGLNEVSILDNDAKKIYLKKLIGGNKISLRKAMKYLKNLFSDIKESFSDTFEFLEMNIWPFKDFDSNHDYFYLFLINCVLAICYLFFSSLIILPLEIAVSPWIWALIGAFPQLIYLAIPITYVILHGKKRIERLKKFVLGKKIDNEKIKTLSNILNVETKEVCKIGDNFENVVTDKIVLKGNISKQIDVLVNNLSLIDEGRRGYFASEIKKILNVYKEEILKNKKVQDSNCGKGLIPTIKDSEIALRTDILDRISKLELEMMAVIQSYQQDNRVLEIEELEEKIDSLVQNDKTYIKNMVQ